MLIVYHIEFFIVYTFLYGRLSCGFDIRAFSIAA